MYTNFKLLLTTSHLPVSSGNGSQRKKWQHEFYFSCWIIIVYLAWKWFKEDSTISCVPVFRVSPLPALCLLWFCPSAAPAKKCNETGSTVHLPQPARLSATTGKADRLEKEKNTTRERVMMRACDRRLYLGCIERRFVHLSYSGYWLKKSMYPKLALNLTTAESRPDFRYLYFFNQYPL